MCQGIHAAGDLAKLLNVTANRRQGSALDLAIANDPSIGLDFYQNKRRFGGDFVRRPARLGAWDGQRMRLDIGDLQCDTSILPFSPSTLSPSSTVRSWRTTSH